MNKEDQTKSILVWSQPFTITLEDLEAHVLAHSSERENSDSESNASKVERQKTEAQCSCLLPQKPKETNAASRNVWWLDNGRAQSPQRKTWISEQSPIRCPGTKFSTLTGIRVKPKLHRRRRRIYESSFCRRSSRKLVIRTICEILASIVKNYLEVIETLHIID